MIHWPDSWLDNSPIAAERYRSFFRCKNHPEGRIPSGNQTYALLENLILLYGGFAIWLNPQKIRILRIFSRDFPIHTSILFRGFPATFDYKRGYGT